MFPSLVTQPFKPANQLRIIGGAHRGRIIRFPQTEGLRPTPDRVRETLFNWLGQRLDGLRCLDLFAGAGALGVEALSRGASEVVFVERDRAVAMALRKNLELIRESVKARVIQGDALASLGTVSGPFDVVFVDPPYASGLLTPALAAVKPLLAEGARVYAEDANPVAASGYVALRQARAGAVHFALLSASDHDPA